MPNVALSGILFMLFSYLGMLLLVVGELLQNAICGDVGFPDATCLMNVFFLAPMLDWGYATVQMMRRENEHTSRYVVESVAAMLVTFVFAVILVFGYGVRGVPAAGTVVNLMYHGGFYLLAAGFVLCFPFVLPGLLRTRE